MSYNRGFLNKRITVLNAGAQTVTDFGRKTESWEVAGTCWANVTFNRGTKSLREGAYDAYDVVLIRCDCHQFLHRSSRIVYDGKTWQILTFNADHDADEVQITATELQQ